MVEYKHKAFREQVKIRAYDDLLSYLDGLLKLNEFEQIDSLLKGWEPDVMGKEQTVIVLLVTKPVKEKLINRINLINKFEGFLLRTEISLRDVQEKLLKYL